MSIRRQKNQSWEQKQIWMLFVVVHDQLRERNNAEMQNWFLMRLENFPKSRFTAVGNGT